MRPNHFIIFVFVLFLGSHLNAEPIQAPSWKTIESKKLKSKLKSIAYAKIRSTTRMKLKFEIEKKINYTKCPLAFPELPGEFPCSLLHTEGIQLFDPIALVNTSDPSTPEALELDTISSESTVTDGVNSDYLPIPSERIESLDSIEGGVISLWESTTKSPLIDGKVYLLSEDKQESKDTEAFRIHYHPNGQLHFYTFKDNVLLFLWKKETEGETLSQIIWLKRGKDDWVTEAKEIDFQSSHR